MRGTTSEQLKQLSGREARAILAEFLRADDRARQRRGATTLDLRLALGWLRVSDLARPSGLFSKAYIFQLLREGRLRGKKVGAVTLVELRSLEELLESAEDWTPGESRE